MVLRRSLMHLLPPNQTTVYVYEPLSTCMGGESDNTLA